MNNVLNTQTPYVDEKGDLIKPKDNKRILIFVGIIIGIILLLTIIILVANNTAKIKACNNLEDLIENAALDYAKDNEKLPTLVTGPITFTKEELVENGYLNSEEFKVKDTYCNGGVKLTNVDGKPFATVTLTDCNICSSDKRYGDSWSEETDKFNSKKRAVDVIVYYNYVEKKTHVTAWTNYLTPQVLETRPIVAFNDNRLDVIPNDAKNIELESEDLTYYKSRKKTWKFYKNNIGGYSALSSEQPAGYSMKDNATMIETEYSDWSLTAPEVKDYRSIQEQTGYRWYLEDGKEKIYWNSGAYWPENPDQEDKTYIKEKKDPATVWRYKDRKWRWYNGNSRGYSGYLSNPNKYYPYKDTEIVRYTSFSSFKPESLLNDSNRHYLDEVSEVRTRFRVKYDLYSFNKLENSVLLEDFESASKSTVADIELSDNKDIVVTYKYIYRK